MDHSTEFLALVDDARSRVAEVDVALLARWRAEGRDHLLVDVREDSEWQRGRVAGAIHLGRGVIERDIVARVPDKATAIVLYCGGGFRSALAADSLQRMGYRCVWSLAGGWRACLAHGLTTEVDP